MKTYLLDEHSSLCDGFTSYGMRSCSLNPVSFLFFMNNDFYLMTYFRCMEYGDKYGFKIEILKSVLDSAKAIAKYKAERSWLDDDLVRFRNRGIELKTHITQVNYTYQNAAGKEFCFITKTEYLNALINQDEVDYNFKKALDYITENGFNYLIPELKYLHSLNYVKCSETEIVKSIDHIIKSINNHGINKKSKLENSI